MQKAGRSERACLRQKVSSPPADAAVGVPLQRVVQVSPLMEGAAQGDVVRSAILQRPTVAVVAPGAFLFRGGLGPRAPRGAQLPHRRDEALDARGAGNTFCTTSRTSVASGTLPARMSDTYGLQMWC